MDMSVAQSPLEWRYPELGQPDIWQGDWSPGSMRREMPPAHTIPGHAMWMGHTCNVDGPYMHLADPAEHKNHWSYKSHGPRMSLSPLRSLPNLKSLWLDQTLIEEWSEVVSIMELCPSLEWLSPAQVQSRQLLGSMR